METPPEKDKSSNLPATKNAPRARDEDVRTSARIVQEQPVSRVIRPALRFTREEFMSSEYDEKNRKQNEPGQSGRDKSAGSREENPQGQQTEREGEGQNPGSSNPSGRSGESESE